MGVKALVAWPLEEELLLRLPLELPTSPKTDSKVCFQTEGYWSRVWLSESVSESRFSNKLVSHFIVSTNMRACMQTSKIKNPKYSLSNWIHYLDSKFMELWKNSNKGQIFLILPNLCKSLNLFFHERLFSYLFDLIYQWFMKI